MENTFTPLGAVMLLLITATISCRTTINPGQVGFVVHRGVVQPGILSPGRYHHSASAQVVVMNTRITEYSTVMSPPTKEGLEVKVNLTVLYHIKPDAAPTIYTNVGLDYGNTIVINNFMAIVREYTMTYSAVELLGERETIEKNIEDKLRDAISPYGIVLDDVLVKDIDMPVTVLQAIEAKAKADQVAKQTTLELQTRREREDFDIESRQKELKFALEKQKSDSLTMMIQANALRNYQLIVGPSLTDRLLKFKSIEVTKELVASPNAKVIITDGKTMMVNTLSDK